MPGPFMTEKEIEALLEFQTRDLPWPDGRRRPFTMTKWYWNSYDFLIWCTAFTPSQLVATALAEAAEMNRRFEDSFPDLLAYAHRVARAKNAGL